MGFLTELTKDDIVSIIQTTIGSVTALFGFNKLTNSIFKSISESRREIIRETVKEEIRAEVTILKNQINSIDDKQDRMLEKLAGLSK